MSKRILVQTTISETDNDWAVSRFSMLIRLLRQQRDADGQPAFEVIARDRAADTGPDSVLAGIDRSGINLLWLLAVDTGNGLHPEECQAIQRFHQRGGGLIISRDHMDLGSSVCGLPGIGLAHHFHSVNPESDERRRVNDDRDTAYIHWPNYHSGKNGDYHAIQVCQPVHPLLADSASPTGAIRYFPAHPHEGAISAPDLPGARVIATGTSKVSGNEFNLAVAIEAQPGQGRVIAHSTFHHFADYNWDSSSGCPGFVSEAPGDGMQRNPAALADIQRYVVNAAHWLAQRPFPKE